MEYFTWSHFGIAVLLLLGLNCSEINSFAAPSETKSAKESHCFRHNSYDGSHNEWCFIFSKGLQLWKSIILGEADLGHPSYHSVCFVTTLDKDQIEWKDAIQKLKEKVTQMDNQEESISDHDEKTIIIEWVLELQATEQDLDELGNYCSNAKFLYMTKSFVDKIINDVNVVNTKLLTSAIDSLPISNTSAYPYCEEARHSWELGCICKRNVCIPDSPCGLMHCPGKEEHSDVCGVKTCTKCTNFEFYVPKKKYCFWNIKDSISYH